MPMELLKCKSLTELADGACAIAVDHEIQRVVKDMLDRPTLDKPRKVQLTLEFRPNALHENATDLEDVRVGFKVKASIPDYGPVQVQMTPKQDGSLVFHPSVNEDPNQSHIMDEVDRRTGRSTEAA